MNVLQEAKRPTVSRDFWVGVGSAVTVLVVGAVFFIGVFTVANWIFA